MELLDSFHFSRPWALLLIPVIVLQVLWYLRFRHASNPWQERMRPDLQQQLLAAPKRQSNYLVWTLLALILAGVALAGPSWSQQSRPLLSKQDNLVIVLDLSLSMLAQDSKPNRITRSKQKLHDLLEQRTEGMTALVVFSGEAHTVTPLTRDTATIRNLLPALEPEIMPQRGSAAERGVALAVDLVKQSGFQRARLLLVTDGLDDRAQKAIPKLLSDSIKLSLLTVGSTDGAPIVLKNSTFLQDSAGSVVISQLDTAALNRFASETDSLIHPISLDDQDLSVLLPAEIDLQQIKEEQAQLPIWIEQGHWFLLPVLPLAALAFRRNWLMLIPLLLLLPMPKQAQAFWPQDSQVQGEQAFSQGDYQAAERLLKAPEWLGSTYYKQGEYEKALTEFAKDDSAQGHYNRGNALAQLGRFAEAMSAYSQALEQQPQHADARYNRDLVEQLLKQEQENESEKEQGEKGQNQSATDPSQQDKNQPSQNQTAENQTAENQQASPQNQNTQNQAPQQRQEQEAQDLPQNQELEPNQEPAEPDQSAQEKRSAPVDNQPQAAPETQALSEEELSLEQWLRRIPDDPSGLLRRKFEHEANRQRYTEPQDSEGRQPW